MQTHRRQQIEVSRTFIYGDYNIRDFIPVRGFNSCRQLHCAYVSKCAWNGSLWRSCFGSIICSAGDIRSGKISLRFVPKRFSSFNIHACVLCLCTNGKVLTDSVLLLFFVFISKLFFSTHTHTLVLFILEWFHVIMMFPANRMSFVFKKQWRELAGERRNTCTKKNHTNDVSTEDCASWC